MDGIPGLTNNLVWQNAGDGPVEDITIYRAKVSGGWLYMSVVTDSAVDKYSGHNISITEKIATSFVPDGGN